MPSYRFCRPDDIPSLVEAVNSCYAVHFGPAEEMTVESFRVEMKQRDVWPSNSLLTWAEDRPIAVLIGTKRPSEVQVRRIGVRPGEERRGHGRHLLDSLARKLGVLGPPRLVAEVPADDTRAQAFFAACGYRPEAVSTDWRWAGPIPEPGPAEVVAPQPVQVLLDEGPIREERRAWDRQLGGLRDRAGDLEGLAAVSPERIEAAVVLENDGRRRRVVAWGVTGGSPREGSTGARLLALALRTAVARAAGALELAALEPDETDEGWLRGLGFVPHRRIRHLAGDAITV